MTVYAPDFFALFGTKGEDDKLSKCTVVSRNRGTFIETNHRVDSLWEKPLIQKLLCLFIVRPSL